jgi:ADP-ribose pyrophosphatase
MSADAQGGDGERLSRRVGYDGKKIRVDVDHIRLPNGHEMQFELIRHPGAAAVVPILPGGEVVLVRQYRYATGGWLLEIPAGTLDGDESPESCAHREIEEEIGYRAGHLEPLGWIWSSPGFCDERIWLYLATDLTPTRQGLEHDEVLTVETMLLAEAIDQAARGEIVDSKSTCALLRAARFLERAPSQ